MKYKLFLTTILFSFVFFFFTFEAKSIEFFLDIVNRDDISTEEKIEILQKEIDRLSSIVSRMQSLEKIEKEINAESYLIMDLSNNSILLEKNSDSFYPIASITKLMSAIVVLENINLQDRIVLTDNMLRPLEIPLLSRYGQSPSIFPGLNISAENLLKASLIQSTNAANQALTHFLEKGKFIELMNEKAEELNMESTVFYDTHGLNFMNHSSAPDLAKLIKYIHENHPLILEITKNDDFWLPDPSGRLLKFKNMNNFHENESFVGGKTGYLTVAKQTLASIFKAKENLFSIILLRSNNRESDVSRIIDWLNL